jgi:hypothetical protein
MFKQCTSLLPYLRYGCPDTYTYVLERFDSASSNHQLVPSEQLAHYAAWHTANPPLPTTPLREFSYVIYFPAPLVSIFSTHTTYDRVTTFANRLVTFGGWLPAACNYDCCISAVKSVATCYTTWTAACSFGVTFGRQILRLPITGTQKLGRPVCS